MQRFILLFGTVFSIAVFMVPLAMSAQQEGKNGGVLKWGPVRYVLPGEWKTFSTDEDGVEVLIEPVRRDPKAKFAFPIRWRVMPKLRGVPHTLREVTANYVREVTRDGNNRVETQQSVTIGQSRIPAFFVRLKDSDSIGDCYLFVAGEYIVCLSVDYQSGDDRTLNVFRSVASSVALGKGTLRQPVQR